MKNGIQYILSAKAEKALSKARLKQRQRSWQEPLNPHHETGKTNKQNFFHLSIKLGKRKFAVHYIVFKHRGVSHFWGLKIFPERPSWRPAKNPLSNSREPQSLHFPSCPNWNLLPNPMAGGGGGACLELPGFLAGNSHWSLTTIQPSSSPL